MSQVILTTSGDSKCESVLKCGSSVAWQVRVTVEPVTTRWDGSADIVTLGLGTVGGCVCTGYHNRKGQASKRGSDLNPNMYHRQVQLSKARKSTVH